MRWLLVLLAVLAPIQATAALNVETDSRVIQESETLRVRLSLSGPSPDDALDLTPLERDFEIVGQQTASKFSSINGRIESSTEWTLTLRPRRTGRLVIPPLEVGGERSSSITIEVRPLDPAIRDHLAQQVFFDTQTVPDRVYVQAQLIVVRRLHYAEGVQLYGELPSEPAIPGAIVQHLADATHRAEIRNGERYGLIEQAFAVFPERSGPLVIPAASLTASVTYTDGVGRRRRTETKVVSDELTIDVLPVPSEYPADAPWLPARRVEVLEDWPGQGEALEVGQPRERAILVRAEGAAASMIPPVAPSYGGALKTYPNPPQLQDLRSGDGLVGIRTEIASLVPTHPGTVELPGVTLTWWDTANEVVRRAVLPSRLESVVGKVSGGAEVEPTPPESTTDAVPAEPRQAVGDAPTERVDPGRPRWAPVPAAIALVAVLLTALVVWTWRHARWQPARRPLREPRAFGNLRAACHRTDLHAIRVALDAWLGCRYGTGIDEALRRFTADREARASVDALNAALYGGRRTDFEPGHLLRSVQAARRSPRRERPPLPPLYPA